ncbi:MAG: hypothetical protein ACXWR0_19595 [Bdellovibrio sp.]
MAVVMLLGVYPTEQTPDIDAKIQLGLVKNIKDTTNTCDIKKLKIAYKTLYGHPISPALAALFEKKNLERYTTKMVDNLISQINDPKKTPYGDLDGNLGETRDKLFSTVKLNGSQRDRFYNAVSNALKRNKKYFSTINDNCETKDLRSTLPTAQNQKNSSLCYAFSLATQLNQQLLTEKERKKDPISSAFIAMAYQYTKLRQGAEFDVKDFKDGPTPNEGGMPEEVLDIIKKTGVCRNSEISNNFASLKGVPTTLAEFKKIYPKLSEKQISQAIKPDKWETIITLNQLVCPHRLPVDMLEATVKKGGVHGTNMDIIATAQERLKTNAVVSYADQLLFGHAMTIVGQRKSKKNGQCEFIIRNSYGKDCGASTGDLPKYMTKTCDGKGNFIISAPVLLENIQNIYMVSRIQKGQGTTNKKDTQIKATR